MRLYYWLLDLLFPPRCILCRTLLQESETDLCGKCRAEAPYFPVWPEKLHPSGKKKLHFLDSFNAVWYYEKDVRESILRYKFYNARYYASAYGKLLAMKLQQAHPDGFDVITWVPISRKRKWKRGYDQSALLARAVAEQLSIPAQPLLRKIRNNPPQSHMDAEQRRANVLGMYAATQPEAIRGKRILLLDDVFTTGSTAEECARVLLTAGAKQVHGAAIAAAQNHEK